MSQNISITQIDQNLGNWIAQFLTSNGQQVTNTIQDKITTLYLLQNAKLLAPVALDDILQVSHEFIQGIILANKQSDQGDRTNRLVALVLLYNLGAVNPNDHQYMKNPRFNEVFLVDNNQPLTGNNIRSALTPAAISIPSAPKPFVATPSVPRQFVATPPVPKPFVATLSAPKPFVATPSVPRPFVATLSVTKPSVPRPIVVTQQTALPIVTRPIKATNPVIVEGNYKYMICQQCRAHIYNDEGICGLCEDEDLLPEEILEQIQIENYIDTDPNYVDFEDYYDEDSDEYDDYREF